MNTKEELQTDFREILKRLPFKGERLREISQEYKASGRKLPLFTDKEIRKATEKYLKDEKEELKAKDSIGIVCEEDFEDTFHKEFIQENFPELASLWFSGLANQIDFGIVLESVEDEMRDKYAKWKEKKEAKK